MEHPPPPYPSLPIEHPLYNVLKELIERIPEIPIFKNSCLSTQKHSDGIIGKIETKTESPIPTYSYSYAIPLSLSEFEGFDGDIQVQTSIDTNLHTYEIVKEIDEETKEFYLRYKKNLIVSSRDFYYVKLVKKIGNVLWILTKSLPQKDEIPGVIRCEIIGTVTRVEEESKNSVVVSVYSEIDMKVKLKPEQMKAKAEMEIKKYINKVVKWAKENYPKNEENAEESEKNEHCEENSTEEKMDMHRKIEDM